LSERNPGSARTVLIIHPDAIRADEIGKLIANSGGEWSFRPALAEDLDPHELRKWYAAIIYEQIVLDECGQQAGDLRQFFPDDVVLVGLISSTDVNSPQLFGSGLDLVLYEPIVLADIERTLSFVDAIQNESRQQARDRLRKLTALHELAIASAHRTGVSGWLDRLIEAGGQILGSDALAMWSIDHDNDTIRCIGSVGLNAAYIESAEQHSPSLLPVYEDLPKELTTHWLASTDMDDNCRVVALDAARAIGIERIAWLPVRDANRLYGHLSFYFMSDATFNEYDLVLADAFSSIVAAALGTFWLQSEIRRTNRLYREHVESSPDGVVVCLPDGTVERSNPAIERITGCDTYEIIGQSIFDWFLPQNSVSWDDWVRRSSDEPAATVDLWLSRSNGERRRVSCYARRVTFPDPRRLDQNEHRIQVVVHDITDSARRLVELELFHDLTRLISDRRSLDEAYELVVSRLYNYLNYRLVTIGEVVDGNRLELQAYRTHMMNVNIPIVADITDGVCGRAVRENRSILLRDVSKDPDYYSIDEQVLSEIVAVIRASESPIGIIDIQTDATQPLDEGDLQLAESIAAHLGLLIEQVSIQERLERQALTDPLTGIANRRAFMRHLHSLVSSPDSTPAALLLVELDHFKSVNDRFGHLFGDEMLKQVAQRLQTALRDNDILARYGGDEIAMIFYDLSPDQAMEIAERLRNAISCRPFSYCGATTDLTVSIGISLFPFHGRTTDELIGEADRAMYAAKLEGRNSVQGHIPLVD
jgi:diguanylate cyclase (GGDEF)-like protein/PAS domain S-box-containing protein